MAKDRSGVEYLGIRKDGKKHFRVHVTWKDPLTGKKREAEKTVDANGKLHAMQKRAAFLLEKTKAAAVLRPVERKRLRQVAQVWHLSVDRRSTNKSWGSYMRSILKWEPPAMRGTKLGDAWVDMVSEQLLQAYLASLADRGLAMSTMVGHRVVLKHIFDQAKSEGLISANPANDTKVKKPRRKVIVKKKRKALSSDEAVRFMADIMQHEPELYVFLMTQYVLGCRFAEISALHWEDVDLKTGFVSIVRGQVDGHEDLPKNDEPRDTAVGMSGLQLLLEHRERMLDKKWPGYETLVFPRPTGGMGRSAYHRKYNHWARCTVSNAIKRSFTRLGLDMGATNHVARHTMNNIARMHGSEAFMRRVRESIGHSGERMSAKYSEQHVAEVLELGQTMEQLVFRPRKAEVGGPSGSRGVSGESTPQKPAKNGANRPRRR